MATKTSNSSRTRSFATVVYEESAPDRWLDILNDWHIPCFVSPYHMSDINPDGQPKKPHWHIMLVFDGVKSDSQVKEIFDSIGGVGLERVGSTRGYARYLCHLDNPDKFQYCIDDVKQLGGADYQTIINLTSDKYKAIDEMIDWCIEYENFSYSILLNYARQSRRDWFRVLCDNGTVVIKEFLKSHYWTCKNGIGQGGFDD